MAEGSKAIIKASEKGYTIDGDGRLFNPHGKELKTYLHKGYLSFGIRFKDKVVKLLLHRYQGYKKFGNQIFNKGLVIRHLNGISTDNSYDNIGIGTNKDNALDIPKTQRILIASHPKYEHVQIVTDYKKGSTYKDIMEKYGITSKGTVSFIIQKSLASQN